MRIDTPPQMLPPDPARFDLLRGLPLSEAEQKALGRIERDDTAQVAHLPFFLVTATKR